ncbi:MAG TPA: serine--tRNA ligase [bacterium (Candidatus Stahlbacteria)]|nr:serine--tRNA ligase [Candidatus Stahlbacteria bacterium]
MVDPKLLREKPDLIREAIRKKGEEVDLDHLIGLDQKRRELQTDLDRLRAERNTLSERIGELKRKRADDPELIKKAKAITDRIKDVETNLKKLMTEYDEKILSIPNIPHASVPYGQGDADNLLVREWGEPLKDEDLLPHWELGEGLGILSFREAAKISGSRFVVYKGWGARLERALINFFIDVHIREHGYVEVFPPFLNNTDCLIGTGQLPKLRDDMYKIEGENLYLDPTAEVPLTNLHREEIIPEKRLPIRYCAYTACFRREAGSYGKDVRGMIRTHQFNKVELVKYATPEHGYEEFEGLLADAEDIVKRLELPYRVRLLCTGDMTFASAKTFDIEVWAAGVQRFLEVSSVSIYEQFQARRANIRYRSREGKVDYVHTMNGSGLATSRIFPAIIENNQTKDGRIRIPGVLRPYLDGAEYIE